MQSPQDLSMEKTIEDTTITDPKERERLFRQHDHFRLYGRDYGERLRKAGFEVTEDQYVQELPPEKVDYYRLPESEIIYFCQKPIP